MLTVVERDLLVTSALQARRTWWPVVLLARDGLGRGELLDLRWSAVDWRRRWVVIESRGGRELVTPVVYRLADDTIEALRRYLALCEHDAWSAGSLPRRLRRLLTPMPGEAGSFVLTGRDGGPGRAREVNRAVRRISHDAGLMRRRIQLSDVRNPVMETGASLTAAIADPDPEPTPAQVIRSRLQRLQART